MRAWRWVVATALLILACVAISSHAAASERTAAEWNSLGLDVAEKPNPDMAVSVQHFKAAYAAARPALLKARRALHLAQSDLAEAKEDALAAAEEAAEMEDDDDELAHPNADDELEAEIESLTERVRSLKAALSVQEESAARYLNNQAVSLMRLNKMDAAAKVLRRALRIDPDSADAKKNLDEVGDWKRKYAAQGLRSADGDEDEEDEDPAEKRRREKERKKRARQLRRKRQREAEEEEEDEEEESDQSAQQTKPVDSPVAADVDDSVYDRPAKRRPQRLESLDSSTKAAAKAKAGKLLPAMDRPRRPNKTHREPLPRIHIKHLQWKENVEYARGRAPFILIGALDEWDLSQWTPASLRDRFPASNVDFYPHNMDKATVRPYMVSMSSALSEQSNPSGGFPSSETHPGAYIQWNVNQADWEAMRKEMEPKLPAMFRRDEDWLLAPSKGGDSSHHCLESDELRNQFTLRTHWRMILIGNRGAGMFNHQDVLRTSSYQAQLWGSKRWHLCGPDQSRYLYGAGTLDVFDPDYEHFPLYLQARCFEDVVSAGEIVFYPKDWWHQTENIIAPSVAVSTTVLDANNHEAIAEELRQECAVKKYKWGFSEELCKSLHEGCFGYWKTKYPLRMAKAKDEL